MKNQHRIMSGVMVTTGIDRRNEVMFPPALYQMAEEINGESAMRMGIEHNRTIPPGGKVLRARVEPFAGGGLSVVGEMERFAPPVEIELPDGTIGLLQESSSDSRPFMANYSKPEEQFLVIADHVNFGSPDELEAFFSEVSEQSGEQIISKSLGRKSFTVEPEIIIGVSKYLATAFAATSIGKKLLDTLSDKVGASISEDIDKLYRVLRTTVISSAKKLHPKHRAITYVLESAGEPSITFVAVTTDPNIFLNSTAIEVLDKALVGVKDYCDRFGAVEIQYLLSEKGDWEFNYLVTATGQTIGTKKAYSRRAKLIQGILERRQKDQQAIDSSVPDLPEMTEEEMLDRLYAPGQPMSVGGVASGIRVIKEQSEPQVQTVGTSNQ